MVAVIAAHGCYNKTKDSGFDEARDDVSCFKEIHSVLDIGAFVEAQPLGAYEKTAQDADDIADEGKAKRAAAEEDLKKMEKDLRDTLAAAKARRDGVGDTAAASVPAG